MDDGPYCRSPMDTRRDPCRLLSLSGIMKSATKGVGNHWPLPADTKWQVSHNPPCPDPHCCGFPFSMVSESQERVLTQLLQLIALSGHQVSALVCRPHHCGAKIWFVVPCRSSCCKMVPLGVGRDPYCHM